MRTLLTRALALSGVLFVLLVLGSGQVEAAALTAAVVAIAAVAAFALVALLAPARPVSGSRCAARRTQTASQPEPSHPRTAGRTRSRAPGVVIAAA